jgi:hypothetical protein
LTDFTNWRRQVGVESVDVSADGWFEVSRFNALVASN